MNLSEAGEAIKCAFLENTPILMWGEPGIGKSSIVNQLAIAEDVELRTVMLSQYESVDLRGVPDVKDGTTRWNPPDFLPRDPDSVGILHFDEINQADDSTQKASYQLIQERRLGDYFLPIGWRIIGSGNPGNDRITEALGNRFLHIDVTPTIQDWGLWAHKNHISTDIIGLLMARPELLIATPTNQDDYAFPSPRTWEFANRFHQHHANSSAYKDLIVGCIGKGAYAELMGYINLICKLPTLVELAANPTNYDFTSSPSKTAALCLMIVSGADLTNIDPLMTYINTIQTEFQVLTITLLNETKNNIMASPSITQWCIANPNIF